MFEGKSFFEPLSKAHSGDGAPQDAYLIPRDDGSEIGMVPAAPKCRGFAPGHSVHHIHARVASEHPDWFPVRILSIDGKYIDFMSGSRTVRRWHHDADAVRRAWEMVEVGGSKATWCERYRLLRISVGRAGLLLHLGMSDEHACLTRSQSKEQPS